MTVKRSRRYCSRARGRRDRALVSTARSQIIGRSGHGKTGNSRIYSYAEYSKIIFPRMGHISSIASLLCF